MLDWFASEAAIDRLIAAKNYSKATKLLRSQLRKEPKGVRLRQKMADVLLSSGQDEEAAELCEDLVDEFANAGFFGKAIAVLKKLQRFQPECPGIEAKLAAVIKMKEGENAFPAMLVPPRAKPAAPEAAAPEPLPAKGDDGTPLDLDSTAVRMQLEFVEDFALGGTGPASSGLQGSPLFKGFTEEQLLAVIRGLRLASFGPGEIIVTENEPGQSMFLIASGSVRIYVQRADGGNAQVRTMGQGDFFGEISLLSQSPRTATITAAAACDLLELDRDDLKRIAIKQPQVMEIVESFCSQRTDSKEELKARYGNSAPPVE